MQNRLAHDQKQIDKYMHDRQIDSHIAIIAVLACMYLEANVDEESIRYEVKQFYNKNRKELLQIKSEVDEICAASKQWECQHWFGGTQKPLTNEEINKRNMEVIKFDKERKPPVAGLQKICYQSDGPLLGQHEDFEILMLSSAGRVLLTIQDAKPQGKFNGAWITLVFDETADYPRGGVQGQCGTKDELLALLKASSDNLPELKPRPNLSLVFV